MLLIIAATEFERDAFKRFCTLHSEVVRTMVSGVGLVETAVSVTRFLERHHNEVDFIVNVGIGGAYKNTPGYDIRELDICLASSEILGDYGICAGDEVIPFDKKGFFGPNEFELDSTILHRAKRLLDDSRQRCHVGPFVSVLSASGTSARGDRMRERFDAICENMEGGAIARVCADYEIPLLEVRSVSNYVEDRPGRPWKTEEAANRAGLAASLIVQKFLEIS